MFSGYTVDNKKFTNTWKAVDYAESVKGHVILNITMMYFVI